MDKRKANTNVKTTMDFFKQKRAKESNKKLPSNIESKDKASVTTASQFNNTIQGIYKTDINEIDSFLSKMKPVLTHFTESKEKLLSFNKDFNKKIHLLQENIEKDSKDSMATNRINSLNLNYLLKEYKCNDKDTLLTDIAFENFTLKLILEKLDDLFFLINLKILDFQNKFSNNYKSSSSLIGNVKYLCDEISSNENLNISSTLKYQESFNMSEIEGLEKGLLPLSHSNTKDIETTKKEGEQKSISESKDSKTNINTTKKSMDGPSVSYELKDIPVEIVTDINNKIKEMKKFSDFLSFDYDQDDFFKDIFERIRELFYVYNKHMFDPIVDLVNEKFQVKSALSKKVQIVLKNEVNDIYENVILMRKVLEDYFKENQSTIKELNNDKKILENKYKELETKFNKQKKTLEEIGNRDYSNYYKQMKESNETFLKEFEKLEKQRNEKLYEQYEKQLEKNKSLKKEVKDCRSEIFALKLKLDNINAIKDKSGDEYISALQEQFEDAKQSFQDEISTLTDEFYKKRNEMQKKFNTLEKENKHLKGIQTAMMKKLNTMESLFSK